MSHANVFLNTAVENTGYVEGFANFCLTPVRYLWRGHTIRNLGIADPFCHRVTSFHEDGATHVSRTEPTLVASERGMLKTALAIVCLIPGFIIGVIFKGLSYLSADVRTRHAVIKTSMTPRVVEFFQGETNPTPAMLSNQLNNLSQYGAICCPTTAVVIHGNHVLNIDRIDDSQDLIKLMMLRLNPLKIIFNQVVMATPPNSSMFHGRWEESILDKWERDPLIPERTVETMERRTVEEALNDRLPPRPGTSRPYHRFYRIR